MDEAEALSPYWLDAQLPPQLAPWLTLTFGVTVFSVAYLGYRDAEDETIFEAACLAGAVIVSKDSDFLDRVQRRGHLPQLLYVTSSFSMSPVETAVHATSKRCF